MCEYLSMLCKLYAISNTEMNAIIAHWTIYDMHLNLCESKCIGIGPHSYGVCYEV